MKIRNYLKNVSNSFNVGKKYMIFPYTYALYSLFLILEKYCIHIIFLCGNWILVILKNNKYYKFFKLKTFGLKNKQNIYTYYKLKELFKYNKHGIIMTSKGFCSLNTALKLKQGGILFCLIYFS